MSETSPAVLPQDPPGWVWPVIGGLTLVALAIALRTATASGMWRDEALCVGVATLPTLSAMLDFLAYHESHPPLFYVALRLWTYLFGTGDGAALTLPMAFGAARVPLVYLAGRRLYSWPVALIAASFVAWSSALSYYAAQVRPYSLLPLLTLGAAVGLYGGLRGGTRRDWWLYGGCTLALLLTHNWGWLVVAGQAAVGLAFVLREKAPASTLRCFGMSLLLALLPYTVWLPFFLGQALHAGHPPAPIGLDEGLRVLKRCFTIPPASVLLPAITLGLVAASGDQREDRLRLALLAGVPVLTFVVSWALSPHSQLLFDKTQLAVMPCVWLVAAAGLWRLWGGVPRVLALEVVGIAAVFGLLMAVSAPELKSNAREAAATVTRGARPSDLVVVAPEWLSSSFNRYFEGANRQVDFPVFNREVTMDFVDVGARTAAPVAWKRLLAELDQARRLQHRVWLVTHPYVQPDLNLMADAPMPFGPRDAYQISERRASQTMTHLIRLYGKPVYSLGVAPQTDYAEKVVLYLFAAGD